MRRLVTRLLRRLREPEPKAELERLTSLVRRYTVEQQQVPRDLVELVARKYLAAVPVPPPGQRFVIDRTRVEVRLEQGLSAGRSYER
jgi:hypothetical protein